MITNEAESGESKRLRTVLKIVQSSLIVILIVLVALMMVQINRLQGTARVINYAGLVRGATQRLVKLELTEHPKDELVVYLDEVLMDLKYGEGRYELVSLADDAYQEKLDELLLYWGNLKGKIEELRANDCAPESKAELLDMSEIYFGLADETVSAAEIYSDKIAKWIRVIELISAIDMFLLFCLIVEQSVSDMRMRKRNTLLAQKAYIDIHTGLQNKNMCEELLADRSFIKTPTACLIFDINNLKDTNDTLGHSVGDRLIADFAGCLKSVVRENDFAGRCGGDEFIIILHEMKNGAAEQVLARLQDEVKHFNALGTNIPISYAAGWAVSTDYPECTLRTLFDAADCCMYENKRKMKKKQYFGTNILDKEAEKID